MNWKPSAIAILREFVADVEAVHDWARKEWPDLMVTYRKAKGFLDEPQPRPKSYVGIRFEGRVAVSILKGTVVTPLPHIEYHSPDGFEWGYPGSGPADTALSILTDYFGDDPSLVEESKAFLLHQHFKDHFLVRAPKFAFVIKTQQIVDWVENR